MKLRGLSAIILVVGIAALGLIYSRAQKSKISESDNVIQSHKTNDFVPKNAIEKLKNVLTKNSPTKESEFTERMDFEQSLVAGERYYTESEISEMKETQFAELLKSTELKFPKISDLKELPAGALHTTPAPVISAGKDLGLIKEILRAHENYAPLALNFYETCAKNAERPTPVRALCLTNFIEIKKKNGEKVNMKDYPSTLVELTKMITDI
ncbi:MAG: hypothetical protein K2Q18_07610 [Bdellovibrionales bacterium]|nr:hypothetical protein [Bdellovibrionales bacterium]